jgi:hypothetical protein
MVESMATPLSFMHCLAMFLALSATLALGSIVALL